MNNQPMNNQQEKANAIATVARIVAAWESTPAGVRELGAHPARYAQIRDRILTVAPTLRPVAIAALGKDINKDIIYLAQVGTLFAQQAK